MKTITLEVVVQPSENEIEESRTEKELIEVVTDMVCLSLRESEISASIIATHVDDKEL